MPAGARACSEASRNSASFYCSDSSAIDMDGGSRKPRPPYHVGGTRPRRGWFHCGYQRPPPGFHDPKGAAYMQGYGMGYQLCDNSTGVVFNGNTRVILLNNTAKGTNSAALNPGVRAVEGVAAAAQCAVFLCATSSS
ncbi:hypothetical protein HPB50_029224 [Hyalomma asiaticum]|nr:hypothetical protein HPB50_029224 [Hyalomma asiaticum]